RRGAPLALVSRSTVARVLRGALTRGPCFSRSVQRKHRAHSNRGLDRHDGSGQRARHAYGASELAAEGGAEHGGDFRPARCARNPRRYAPGAARRESERGLIARFGVTRGVKDSMSESNLTPYTSHATLAASARRIVSASIDHPLQRRGTRRCITRVLPASSSIATPTTSKGRRNFGVRLWVIRSSRKQPKRTAPRIGNS